ncbi:MAG TPA: FecR domain-containing protein, partial [Casimicrobiaceae bacterium]|nr:FecR domain-containing protein [Casimicrobiaceae bacterium]
MSISFARAAILSIALCVVAPAGAADIGQIKVSKGQVTIEREGRAVPAAVGTRLQIADVVKTGANGSVGITMDDDSLLSAGPNSMLSLDRYAFDPTTRNGRFDASLNKGTLAVISGRIAKQAADSMTIRTPAAILGVRGTEFVVGVND